MRSFPLHRWIFLMIAARILAAFTHTLWNHPDEWYQTVEQGNWIANGVMSWTEGLSLHLRNLTWPALIAGAIRVAQALDPASLQLKHTLIRLLTVLADLTTLWGIFALVTRSGFEGAWRKFALAVLVLPWFLIQDATRPSQEHLSLIAMWAALGGFVTGRFRLAGFFGFLAGVFRYPSLLIWVGLLAAVLVSPIERPSRREAIQRFAWGSALALLLGGIADLAVYGRPYESFWMYLQYNVFTGVGAKYYGQQSALVYLAHLRGHWGLYLAPLGAALALLAPLGLALGLARRAPWALIAAAYLAGHLAIGHKEPRFLIPVEPLLVWAAVWGARELVAMAAARGWRAPRWEALGASARRGLAVLGMLLVTVNGLVGLRSVWGETWRPSHTYFELEEHLRATPDACAVVTVRRPTSTLLPFSEAAKAPEPALGFFPARPRAGVNPAEGELSTRPVLWVERAPACKEGQQALLHLTRPDRFWSEIQGCELLPSGVLRVVPREHWNWIIAHGWASGSWYRCPARALGAFPRQEALKVLGRVMPYHPELPSWRLGTEGFERLSASVTEPNQADGTYANW